MTEATDRIGRPPATRPTGSGASTHHRGTGRRRAGVIAANDLRRRLRDRTFLIQGIGAPILFALIIGLAFGSGFNFSATIGVASADNSELSRQIVDGFTRQTPSDSPVRFVAVDPSQVDGQVESQAIDAAIVLPAGFGSAVTGAGGATPPPVSVVIDADKRITADVATAIARRVGAQIDANRWAITAALDSGAVADPASARTLASGRGQIDLPIALDVADVSNQYTPVAYFAPSMAILFLFFTIGAGARSLITERREGTLARVRSAPITDTTLLLGKTGAVLVLGLASLLVVWGVTTVAFRARWGDPGAVLVVIVGVVVATTGISILVTGLARTDAQAEGLTSMVAFVLALLGGNFLQPGSLPEVMQRLSLLTPNGWALKSFTQIGAAGAGVVEVLPAVGVMVAMGLVCGLAGLRGINAKVTGP